MKVRAAISIMFILFLFSCGDGKKQTANISDDTLSSGIIHISVDESFKPIIDSQLKVFLTLYPKANVITHYKPEAECLKDLLYDSIRMVIVTRGLTEGEAAFFTDTLGFTPRYGKMASDAIAVVMNKKSKDSIFSVSDIRSILSGSSFYKYRPVMDGNRATSTVRFLLDSVLRGQKFSKEVQAAATSEDVIDYVSGHADAMGFVGVSWIGNKEDSTQLSFLNKVNIANLQCANCDKEVFVKPYQANIVLKRYPLVRGLHYILKENYAGLGSGLVNFLTHEKGQLIFKRAYLAPARMALQVRQAGIEETEL
ncbi:MAG: PstS family phosphate ABC transporter substrate-binding protein [Chitinophagaceae bacterium]